MPENIRINSDMWDDVGIIYKVIDYFSLEPKSSAVELTLELPNKQKIHRVVPYHWIEWIPDGE
jgi:hypothetical protein